MTDPYRTHKKYRRDMGNFEILTIIDVMAISVICFKKEGVWTTVLSSSFAAREEPIGMASSSSSSSSSAPCSLKQFSRHTAHALFLILTGGAKYWGNRSYSSISSCLFGTSQAKISFLQGWFLRDVLQELRGIRHFKWYKLSLGIRSLKCWSG